MAKIENNGLVMTARGKFGKQFIYKKRGDETHISKMPVFNKNKEQPLLTWHSVIA